MQNFVYTNVYCNFEKFRVIKIRVIKFYVKKFPRVQDKLRTCEYSFSSLNKPRVIGPYLFMFLIFVV